ncbi:hypothetical protein FLSI110296_09260 [Flavobacterium sinopsychrotolerans]|jgi:hypothetical protein|uniref:Lipoprotein n=1 Tax=Flavobacterium sinopsychrotolerans TaxID=604089 RepID=A0A1H8JQ11_9FLAO|nr:hypothetical protein [Flavobacterium sinopsychrotolerans]SEN82853.1 hypothetical protein SAMN04487942_1100 [Flavobacterium sinopsychrotolerans]
MKKLILLTLFLLTLVSCSIDDDQQKYSSEILPIDSYTLPESFKLGETYEIKLKYKKPSDCHYFQGIYYDKDLNIRTIGIQTTVLESTDCKPLTTEATEVSFKFYVTNTGSYIFKFYKGEDADGKNIFEEVEVPVTTN